MKRTLLSRASYLGLALIVFLTLAGCSKNNSSGGNSNSGNSSSKSSSNSSSNASSNSSSSGKSSGSNRFVGTWKGTGEAEISGVSLTIKDDGTFTVNAGEAGEAPQSSTYTVSGDTITLKDPDNKGDDATGTLGDDGRLKVADKSGKAYYFVKQ